MSFKCEYARGRRITIGDAKVISVEQARDHAQQILGEAAKVLDPRETTGAQKYVNKVITFAQFFENEYKAWLLANRPDTEAENMRRIKNVLIPLFGRLPLDEIKPRLVEKWRIDRLTKDGVQPITMMRHGKY